MSKKDTLIVKGTEIAVLTRNLEDDFLCLTDIAKYKNELEPNVVVSNWLRLHNTIEFLGVWETLYNPGFKPIEFEGFLSESGSNSFTLSPKRWIEKTNAIGIISRSGRGGGTYAHKDIAFKFASWISVEFELYVVKDYQRLKADEQRQQSLEWNLQRTLSKINYRIHTDAVKEQIIPKEISKEQAAFIYASEADLLNVALFGMTASQWRKDNPEKDGNMRDYATLEQLVVLSNIESINALLIRQGLSQCECLTQLNQTAIVQMKSLVNSFATKRLK